MEEQASFETQAVLSTPRRRRSSMGILGAALAVAAIVGAGILGPRGGVAPDDGAAGPQASAAVAAVVVASPEVQPTTAAGATAIPLPQYPSDVLGLPVWSAAYASRYATPSDRPIAVAGWFAVQHGTGCPTPRFSEDPAIPQMFGVAADADTFCDRAGSLFTAPAYAEPVSPVELRVRPGVPLPYQVRNGAAVSATVLVGRLVHPARTCARRTCSPVLLVDRVIWADGVGQSPTTSILPRLLDRGPRPAWPPPEAGDILVETLIDPATLARIDPAAAAAVNAAEPGVERVWYRLTTGPDPSRDLLRWTATDDATGRLIANGVLSG